MLFVFKGITSERLYWFFFFGILVRTQNHYDGYAYYFLFCLWLWNIFQEKPWIAQSHGQCQPMNLNSCLKPSVLWKHIKKLKLRMYMCVNLQNNQSEEVFSKHLPDIGNDNITVDISSACITFYADFGHFLGTKTELITKCIPKHCSNLPKSWLVERKC